MKNAKSKKETKVYVHTRYGTHLCVFEPDEKKGYIITAPGLEGVITWGRTINHAKEMVKEAIELAIECRAEEIIHRGKAQPRRIAREPLAIWVLFRFSPPKNFWQSCSRQDFVLFGKKEVIFG